MRKIFSNNGERNVVCFLETQVSRGTNLPSVRVTAIVLIVSITTTEFQ